MFLKNQKRFINFVKVLYSSNVYPQMNYQIKKHYEANTTQYYYREVKVIKYYAKHIQSVKPETVKVYV